MDTYKDGNQHLDDLFKEARAEKPLVSMEEVKNIIPSSPAAAGAAAGKAFHFGISQVIVVSGIVISSGLAYFTMKSDKTPADKAKTEQVVQQQPLVETLKQEAPQQIQSSNNKSQSFDKTNTLLASTDKKLIAPPEPKYKKVNLNEENVGSQKLTSTVNWKHNDKQYKIVLTGTDIVSIEIDGATVPSSDYTQHAEAITTAKEYAAARIKEEGDKQQLMNFFDKALRADKLASDENNYVFLLTSAKVYIDAVPQDEQTFTRYSKLYKEQTGKTIAEGDEYQFKMKRRQLVNKNVYGFKVKDDQ
jgi:hypothetical protein